MFDRVLYAFISMMVDLKFVVLYYLDVMNGLDRSNINDGGWSSRLGYLVIRDGIIQFTEIRVHRHNW